MAETTHGLLPPLRRKYRWPICVLLVAAGWLLIRGTFPATQPASPERLDEENYRVQHVAPDLTLRLDNHARVRMIGIRSVVTRHASSQRDAISQQAVRYVTSHVQQRDIRLRFDRERIDGEYRFLAYVYVDDVLLNEEILRRGLAKSSFERAIAEPFRKRLRNAELEAQKNRRGVWSVQD